MCPGSRVEWSLGIHGLKLPLKSKNKNKNTNKQTPLANTFLSLEKSSIHRSIQNPSPARNIDCLCLVLIPQDAGIPTNKPPWQ